MPYGAEQKLTCTRICGLFVLDAVGRRGLNPGECLVLGNSNRRLIYEQWIGRADRETSVVIEVSSRVLPNSSPELLGIQNLFQ